MVEDCRIHTISSPLTKDRDTNITEQTIASRLALEKRSVIPPTLVGTVHFQEFFVFIELQADPYTFWISFSVELGKHLLGLIAFVVDVEPSWGFGEEVSGNKDDTGEHQLDPNDESP